mmetsp:Transcript_37603/g.99986  ORF Transcript_37603/g.99986 Transcript_37603/m.99986 type:complete len:235 (+) Transcript_37603:1990-2694(+)
MPEIQGYGGNLVHGQICTLKDHLDDQQHLGIRAPLRNQRHQTLSSLHIDSADLLDLILVLHDICKHGVKLRLQSQDGRQQHFERQRFELRVLAAHLQEFDHDVCRNLAQLRALYNKLEALTKKRTLCHIRLQVCELDPTQEAFEYLLLRLHRGALKLQQEMNHLRCRGGQFVPVGMALVGVGHQLVVCVLLWQHPQDLQEGGNTVRIAKPLEEGTNSVGPRCAHLNHKICEGDR